MNEMTAERTSAADPYASRYDEEWDIVDRQDPVVHDHAAGPLSDEPVQSFAAEGFLFLEHLLSDREATALRQEAERLAQSAADAEDVHGVIREPESRVVRTVFRIHRNNEAFRSLCHDPRIVDVARQLLGSDVYIHQSRLNYKPGFDGKEFFWHSDFETWHIEDGMPRMRAVSVSINLTQNHEFNGPLMLVRGSHQSYVRCPGGTPEDHFRQSLRRQEYGVPSRDALRMLIERGGGIVAPKGRAGSAVVFDSNTMHGSASNLSPDPRINLFVVYNSVENALVEPFGGTRPRPDFLAERQVVPVSHA